jgi:hypothetical protein
MLLSSAALAWPSLACGMVEALPGTEPLERTGDIAAHMVAGIDRYLTDQLAHSQEQRWFHWSRNPSSPEAYAASVEPQRARLRRILGVVDARVPPAMVCLSPVAGPAEPDARIARAAGHSVYAVRWRVLEGLDAEGLLLDPEGTPAADVVALPDADWTPEMLVGL